MGNWVDQIDPWFLISVYSISIKTRIQINTGVGEVKLDHNARAFLVNKVTYEHCGNENRVNTF